MAEADNLKENLNQAQQLVSLFEDLNRSQEKTMANLRQGMDFLLQSSGTIEQRFNNIDNTIQNSINLLEVKKNICLDILQKAQEGSAAADEAINRISQLSAAQQNLSQAAPAAAPPEPITAQPVVASGFSVTNVDSFSNTAITQMAKAVSSGMTGFVNSIFAAMKAEAEGDAQARQTANDENDKKLLEVAQQQQLEANARNERITTAPGEISGGNQLRLTSNPVLETISSKLSNMGSLLNNLGGFASQLGQIALNSINAISKTVDNSYKSVLADITSKAVKQLDSRLYGLLEGEEELNVNFLDLANDAIEVTKSSQLISTKELVNNIVSLGNQGVAYNLEQRALWATLSDRIVSTFEVTGERVAEAIRIQQVELTDAYMGVEAAVTRTLNSMFQDSSFLTTTYDTIWDNLRDTLAASNEDLGVQILYQLEKWLGALSSVGLNSGTAGNIASAMNQLLTGNIDSLGDQGKILLAMASERAGVSFGDLLVNGVQSGDTVNTLMKSVIEVLQDIYEATEGNNVELSKWSGILGLQRQDWVALENLNTAEIEKLNTLTMDIQAAQEETKYIVDNLVGQRTLLSDRLQNLADNWKYSLGFDIASNEELIATRYITETVEQVLNDTGLGKLGFSIGPLDLTVSSLASTLGDFLTGFRDITQGDLLSNLWQGIKNTWASMKYIGNDYNVIAPETFMNTGGITQSYADYLGDIYNTQLMGGNYVDMNEIKHGSYYVSATYGGKDTDRIKLMADNATSSRSAYLHNLLDDQSLALSIHDVDQTGRKLALSIQDIDQTDRKLDTVAATQEVTHTNVDDAEAQVKQEELELGRRSAEANERTAAATESMEKTLSTKQSSNSLNQSNNNINNQSNIEFVNSNSNSSPIIINQSNPSQGTNRPLDIKGPLDDMGNQV